MGCASFRKFAIPLATALVTSAALAGCAGQEVEFEGKIFDLVGLTGQGQKGDKQMETRAPLVMPPTTQLPKPGPKEQIAAPADWPVDPDERRKQESEEQKVALERYYREGDFSDRAGIDEFEHITGTWDHRPGLLSKKANDAIEDGPEDASAEDASSQQAAE